MSKFQSYLEQIKNEWGGSGWNPEVMRQWAIAAMKDGWKPAPERLVKNVDVKKYEQWLSKEDFGGAKSFRMVLTKGNLYCYIDLERRANVTKAYGRHPDQVNMTGSITIHTDDKKFGKNVIFLDSHEVPQKYDFAKIQKLIEAN